LVDLVERNERLLRQIMADDYAGYDPFDMLNSRIFRASPFYRSPLLRLAVLQFGKRSPVNFRRLLLVPKMRNPKALGLCILGLLEDFHRTGHAEYVEHASQLGHWLIANRCNQDEWHHSCWGYHFDWQARAFYVPRGKPNIISTVYVAKALLGLGETTGTQTFVDHAVDAGYFIDRHLSVFDCEKAFFAYIPGEKILVHNASLWGAAWCSVSAKIAGDDALRDKALAVARTSVATQSANGSWLYGNSAHHHFVDGFHTGYNLEALDLIRHQTGTAEFDKSISDGLQYYKDTFFTDSGIAKYYAENPYPIDMHSFAQAVIIFVKLNHDGQYNELLNNIILWFSEKMYSKKRGKYYYQKQKFFTNKIDYTRWTQSWMYYSIALYNRNTLK